MGRTFAFSALVASFLSLALLVAARAGDEAYRQQNLFEALQLMTAARNAESSGDLDQAALHYSRVVTYAMEAFPARDYKTTKMGSESLPELARRVIYLDLQNLKPAGGIGKRSSSAIVGEIKGMYRKLETLEPTNPSWYYLDGQIVAAAGNYLSAYPKLLKCVSLSGSDPAMRAKAQSLAAHIKPGYDVQLKWQEEEWKRWMAYVNSGQFFRDMAASSSEIRPHTSSDDRANENPYQRQVPDYERRARDAENRNDHAAASRYRGGGNTCADDAKYW